MSTVEIRPGETNGLPECPFVDCEFRTYDLGRMADHWDDDHRLTELLLGAEVSVRVE